MRASAFSHSSGLLLLRSFMGRTTMPTPEQNSEVRTATAARKGRVAEFDAAYVARISEAVYRRRLCDESGEGADLRMIEEDEDNGEKLRNRAKAYEGLTRAYLRETAAADMLSALDAALEALDAHAINYEPDGSNGTPVRQIVRAAIAKATGAP